MYYNLMQWNYNTSTFKVKRLDCMSESSNVIGVCRKFGLLTTKPLSLQQFGRKNILQLCYSVQSRLFLQYLTQRLVFLYIFILHILSGTQYSYIPFGKMAH